jgi:hypothetical protein
MIANKFEIKTYQSMTKSKSNIVDIDRDLKDSYLRQENRVQNELLKNQLAADKARAFMFINRY